MSESAVLDAEFLSCPRLFPDRGRSLRRTALSAQEEKSRVCINEKEYFGLQGLTHTAVISLEGLRPGKIPCLLSHCSQGCFSFFHQLFIFLNGNRVTCRGGRSDAAKQGASQFVGTTVYLRSFPEAIMKWF